MPVAVGQQAPDFTLINQAGQPQTLSDLRGRKVVLVFYPFAFSNICTGELCSLRDRRGQFDDDTVMLGISVDTKHALRVFSEQEGFGFDLLSDFWPHGAVAQAYGVFLEDSGKATRATFVLDRDGVVRWSVVNGPGDARDPDDYRAALAEIE
jgi:peroxiredoxin